MKRIRTWCRTRLLAGLAAFGLIVTALGAASGQTAYAATKKPVKDSSVIEKLTVTFKSSYGEPDEILEPEITVNGENCSLYDIQYRTDYDKWKAGRKVRVEVTIKAENDKVFPVSLTSSACKVTGADFVSARALDNTTLQVRADYKPVMMLGSTESAGWSSSSSKKAIWKAVPSAPGYSLVLYGDSKVVRRMTTEKNSVDLSQYMKDDDKSYYYEVKAIPMTADEKKYLKEGIVIPSEDQEVDWEEVEKTQKNSEKTDKTGAGDGGSLKGNNYIMPDGSKAVNTWKKIGGQWYYFDGSGNRVTGWLMLGDYWYYLDKDGIMKTGWIQEGDRWYYLNEGGDMKTGWLTLGAYTYYLQPYSDGYRGSMFTGWRTIDGKSYYFHTGGGNRPGGTLYTNTTTPDGYWVDGNGVWIP
ncbi:MAG: N-acetylmuramoyl-L-alanine amidase family protein [Lachnospiraceae bacterium]|nr:N-acetylmuramoyl-L-alanine amidase family protein [Lachnospiraceae bacterium]